MRPAAVVFDYDGTLIDSREIKTRNYVAAFERVFASQARDRPAVVASCVRTSGANRFVQLRDTLAALGRSAAPAQEEEWSRLYSSLNAESVARIPEFPSVRPLLRELRGLGIRPCAASGILEQELLRELARRGLTGFFDEIRGGDKLGALRALVERGLGRVLFVGDTDYDRRTAEEAGVGFYLVRDDGDLEALGDLIRTQPPD
jgi:phosphoglycolate phosphatase-like HAD superfamily hydrolase